MCPTNMVVIRGSISVNNKGEPMSETPSFEWQQQAACRNTTEDFFAEMVSKNVKALCAGCPVAQQCLEYALVYKDYGYWGGTTERERQRIRRRLKVVRKTVYRDYVSNVMKEELPIKHGTDGGYQVERKRGMEPCPACLAAHNAKIKDYRSRKKVAV